MGRAPTVTPVDSWPQAITEVAEAGKDLASLIAEGVKLVVDACELVEQLVALGLEPDSDAAIESRRVAHGELAARANGF